MELKRRDFIRQLCYACGSISLIPACTTKISMWRFLSEEEAGLIEAITEQFIPADRDAGATEARVVNFFDKQLTGYYVRHQETYRNALKSVDLSTLEMFGKPFREIDWKDQTHILVLMEKGELPDKNWQEVDQRTFFNMILDHTMQGFYGSPRHGGNCDYVSYKMMKID